MKYSIDIVLPVYTESKNLEKRFIKLYEFLSKHVEQEWIITIAENGSVDNTLKISKFLQGKYKKCRVSFFRRLFVGWGWSKESFW